MGIVKEWQDIYQSHSTWDVVSVYKSCVGNYLANLDTDKKIDIKVCASARGEGNRCIWKSVSVLEVKVRDAHGLRLMIGYYWGIA